MREGAKSASLALRRELTDEAAKQALLRFKGVGAKTASCVLMFCLRRADFPVDTHVWKIALALSWVPKSFGRDETYAHLNGRVPAEIKHALHVLLVKHGKVFKNDVKELRKACKAIDGALAMCGELAGDAVDTKAEDVVDTKAEGAALTKEAEAADTMGGDVKKQPKCKMELSVN